MASIQLKPPESFAFHKPDEWPRWIKRFDQYRIASGLATTSATRQVSTFLYCLGEDAEDVLQSMNVTAEQRATYDGVREKFQEFFGVRRNVVYERARFNRRVQLEGESAEQYIVALYALAENCDYGAMREPLIRDRPIVGIRDAELSERLQLDANLTLESAKKAICQKEAVHGHQQILREGETRSNPIRLDAVRGEDQRRRQPVTRRKRDKHPPTKGKKHCTRCGGDPHQRESCPASDATCHRCKKKGHFSSQCFSKSAKVSSVQASQAQAVESTALDEAYLGTVVADTQKAWTARVQVGDKDLLFKLDTGAEVTAITEETHRSLGNVPLQNPSKILYGPGREPLRVGVALQM